MSSAMATNISTRFTSNRKLHLSLFQCFHVFIFLKSYLATCYEHPLCFQALPRSKQASTAFRADIESSETLSSALKYSSNDDFSMVLDTETRRQQRLERLHNSSAKMPKEPQLERIIIEDDNSNVSDTEDASKPPESIFGETYLSSDDQNNSILSEAPAILMEGAAGTGKTTVLAGRVAHLLRESLTEPQNMIVLSFTNRDANALKDKALGILFNDEKSVGDIHRHDVEKNLWCGTIHAFAINILRKYNNNDLPLRVVSSKEVGNRIRQCLGKINASQKDRMFLYKAALEETNQSIGRLVNYIMRCLELWKEAAVLPTPYAYSIKFAEEAHNNEELTQDDYVELAMRLGIPQNAAILALDIAEDYQTMHASMGSADPSDVALMAHDFLMSNPNALHTLRTKLEHVILDEYQDVSVSQHKLLRLIILGADEEDHHQTGQGSEAPVPVLVGKAMKSKHRRSSPICYSVPKIMCAGDANQSIYGWRGAAPSLTVDGFRNDFPQGLVVPLQTSFRLSRQVLNAANVLLDEEVKDISNTAANSPVAYEISPAAAISASKVASKHDEIFSKLGQGISAKRDRNEIHPSLSIGQRLLLEDGLMSESRSSVFIQGLWDSREEAKYIASEIRKRSKERMNSFSKALKKLANTVASAFKGRDDYVPNVIDSTDVAIMVRSKNMLKMHEEALQKFGIPYVISRGENDASSATNPVSIFRGNQSKLLPMKPVKLITMHKAKGDEFDDVYLSGWTEGVFPHPSSLKTNRQHEERRIAYVALTRARQRVVITYSCVNRVPYFSSNGNKRYVTEQVEPSRFLFDLMDGANKSETRNGDKIHNSSQRQGKKKQSVVEWSQSGGFKEWVAGKNIPHEFAKSYRAPVGYTKKSETISQTRHLPTSPPPLVVNSTNEKRVRCDAKAPSENDVASDHPVKPPKSCTGVPQCETLHGSRVTEENKITVKDSDSTKTTSTGTTNEDNADAAIFKLLLEIKSGLNQIHSRERGACKKYYKIFRAVLKEFGIPRGSAIVLTKKGKERKELSQAVDALARAPDEVLTTRPLSRCTAEQLGLYLVYLLEYERNLLPM